MYGMLQFLSFPLLSLSLFLRYSKLRDSQLKNHGIQPGLQKQIQQGSECLEIPEVAIQAVLATAAHITIHTTTTIPTSVFAQSNTEGGVSSLSDKGTPNKNKQKETTGTPTTGRKKFCLTPPSRFSSFLLIIQKSCFPNPLKPNHKA